MTAEAPTSRRRAAPIEQLIDLWQRNWTLEEIAEEVGVSRQRVSQRLNAAGYSPGERLAQRRAAAGADNRDALAARADATTARVELREEACSRFRARAAELGVTPKTLGQYASRSGPYAVRAPLDAPGNRRGSGKLPTIGSPESDQLIAELAELAAPWSAMHIATMCRAGS